MCGYRFVVRPRSTTTTIGYVAVACLALFGCADRSDGSAAGTATRGVPATHATAPVVIGTVPPAAAETVVPRVLLVGDSTLKAVLNYDTFDALAGFDYVFDAESCRTLGVRSCGRAPVPTNTVETIRAAAGPFDVVVVMAGYDEWWTSFPESFDEVVTAAREAGARHIVWLTYREGVGYVAPDGSTANEAFVRNNRTVRERLATGEYPDVVLADWAAYTAAVPDWLEQDGIHLSPTGAWGVADYVSRVIAHVLATPCPMPWEVGGVADVPCPDPDTHAPPSAVRSLYRPT